MTMVQLADDLLGAHGGSERSPCWSCPDPAHSGQTGRTPPVTIFTDRTGDQRWHCHSCFAGGTAIDLVMQVRQVGVREALQEIASRTGTPPLRPGERFHRRPGRVAAAAGSLSRPSPRVVPALTTYVDECAEALWGNEGAPIRRWLSDTRGLPEKILRANKLGADLGPGRQTRPDGVPAVRRAVVLPVLLAEGACFVQLRTLGQTPGFPKYLNSRDSLTPNPRLGIYMPDAADMDLNQRPEILVTEGIIDALSAATAGYRSVAVLGAGFPDRSVAVTLARMSGPLVVAFDPDTAGQTGARRLIELLAGQRREAGLLRLPGVDLNERAVESQDWPVELAARVQQATYPLSLLPEALVIGH